MATNKPAKRASQPSVDPAESKKTAPSAAISRSWGPRTGAHRRTSEDLQAIIAAHQAYIDAPDHDASRLADASLHLAIANATHNPIIVEISADLRAKISLGLGPLPYTDEVRCIAISQHKELVSAITEQRADEAAEIAVRHFMLSKNLIRDLVKRAKKDVQVRGNT